MEVIKINPAFTSVIGAVNHAQRRGISIHQGGACAASPLQDWDCASPPPCARPSCLCAVAARSPSPCAREESRETCVAAMVGDSCRTQSGACSALAVGGAQRLTRTFVPGNVDIGCHLPFHGAIPWRESLNTVRGASRAMFRFSGIFVYVSRNDTSQRGAAWLSRHLETVNKPTS